MKIELINDNFQNYKRYGIPKAQIIGNIRDNPELLKGEQKNETTT